MQLPFEVFRSNFFLTFSPWNSSVTTGRGKPQEWTTCRACDDSYHLQCLDPPLEFRPNSWKCLSCKESKIKVKKDKNKKEKESKPLFKGEHDDDCFMCFNGGGEIVTTWFAYSSTCAIRKLMAYFIYPHNLCCSSTTLQN